MKKVIGILMMLSAMLSACSADNESGNNGSEENNNTETYEVSTTDLWTSNGSKRIYGRLYTPVGKTGRLPLVIFSHGFGGSYTNLASYAERMAQMGYMAYCFDFCGGSSYSRSDGSTTEMSVLTERTDLEAVIDYFKTRDDIDASRITLAGASQGGFVSALTAADRPSDVCSLVLFYPALCIVDDAHSRWSSYESITSSSLWGTSLGAIYYQDSWNIDVYTEIAKYTGPALLIHGTVDNIVNVSYARRAAQVYQDVEYHELEGAGHGFSGSNRTTSINYMVNFMNAHATTADNTQANKITVTIGSQTFTATLEDNETATAFSALLPMTIDMTELNGNEKYHYLSISLPTNASNPGTIHAGDIMLYGSSCIVLFYETFNMSYSYTKIGHIDDPTGLAEAVGTGNVSVTFGLQTTGISNAKIAERNANDDAYYNLQGMKVSNPTKGIYIHKGKKVRI